MVFRKFVEVGRVCLVNYGPLAGKLVIVVDIINTCRVLVDGPTTGVRRQEFSLKRLSLTELRVEVPKGVSRQALRTALDSFDLNAKWSQTSWAKRMQKATRRSQLSDFDRFKVKTLRQRKALLQHKVMKARQ